MKFDAETKSFYWLTVCAHDHGIVPLHSCIEVCIFHSMWKLHIYTELPAQYQHRKNKREFFVRKKDYIMP